MTAAITARRPGVNAREDIVGNPRAGEWDRSRHANFLRADAANRAGNAIATAGVTTSCNDGIGGDSACECLRHADVGVRIAGVNDLAGHANSLSDDIIGCDESVNDLARHANSPSGDIIGSDESINGPDRNIDDRDDDANARRGDAKARDCIANARRGDTAAFSRSPRTNCGYWLRTTVNCINAFTGAPADDQSIDAEEPAGTANRMYAAPPASIDTVTGAASDSGSTASGYRPNRTPPLDRCGKISR